MRAPEPGRARRRPVSRARAPRRSSRGERRRRARGAASAEDVPVRVEDAGDGCNRAVRVLLVTQRDLAVRLQLGQQRLVGEVATLAVLDRDRQALIASQREVKGVSARSTASATSRYANASDAFGRSVPGSSPASQRIWNPLQIPRTSPRRRRSVRQRPSPERSAPWISPAAEVVADGEASRQDDGGDVWRQLELTVPDKRRLRAEPLNAVAASRSSRRARAESRVF